MARKKVQAETTLPIFGDFGPTPQKARKTPFSSAEKGVICVHFRVQVSKAIDIQGALRRERDSNPRYLSVRRFSRPVHSTTLPSLHRVFEIAVLAVKKVNHLKASLHCGERGIRTPGTSQYAGFQDRCIRPLCHLSNRGNAIDVALQSQ